MTDIEKQISATKLAIQLCDQLGIDYTYGDRGCTLNGEPVPDTGLLFPVKILYKGYTTTPEYDPYDKIYYGKIDGIKDLVDYHAETVDGIGQAIIDCVDEYITFCKEIGKKPDAPDEKNQNQPDENILAAYEKIRRLGNIQSTIFTIADYLYTAAWVWFGLTILLFIIAATVKG